jgi:hypothetical protein
MALSAAFTATQLLGLPETIVVTDTSTGSDGAITSRRVYITDAFNNYIVPEGTTTDYVVWAWADSSINIECLTKDMAVDITVQWLDGSNNVLYDSNALYGFTSFNEDFAYQLTGYLANNYKRTADSGFNDNASQLRLYIDSGDQAISRGGDLMKAQTCYDLATNLRTNAQYVFNTVG